MSKPSNASVVVPPVVARRRVLDLGVRDIVAWLGYREQGTHDPLTTLTLLERKVCDLRDKVARAGGKDGDMFPGVL